MTEDVKGFYVLLIWIILSITGFLLGYIVNIPFLYMCVMLWGMGILYNVKPFRTKDIVILDVLSESLNNAIRLLMGWFIVATATLPPCSLIFGYWMVGAFLMATKRFAEYRMIGDSKIAGLYRKSFNYYTENFLLLTAFFYAMASNFFIGIFLIKYKIELILLVPFLMGLFCYYFLIAFREDSAAQKPEKLYDEKGLMLVCVFIILVFVIFMRVHIPGLSIFVNNRLITIGGK